MVGYQKDDTMTVNQKLVAGCLTGIITRFLTQPLDVIKIRAQVQRKPIENPHKKWFKITRKIFGEEGVTAFWHGHNLGQIQSILGVSSQFYAYEMSTKLLETSSINDKYKPFLRFVCGACAGCFCATLVLPLEVIRLRQIIVKSQYKGIFNGAKRVYQTGGILGFYEGWTASLLQIGPAAGISFGVFNILQPLILHYLNDCTYKECPNGKGNSYTPEKLVIASCLAGGMAGFLSKSLTYPFDLAKKRLQLRTHEYDDSHKAPSTSRDLMKCENLVSCLVNTFKTEGIKGLYRGWKITIYKANITSIVAYTSYELLCYSIREVKKTYTNLKQEEYEVREIFATRVSCVEDLMMVGYEKHDTISPHTKLIAGCLSGATTRFIVQPLDVLKLKTQLQKMKALPSTNVLFRTARRIFREEGITGFYHGHVIGQVHTILAMSSQFYVYELATKYIAHYRLEKKYGIWPRFICGFFAGTCSAAIVNPLEVIRVRQVVAAEQYRGLFNGAWQVFKGGGIRAFYEGLSASILQLGPQVGISFAVFSTVQPWILRWFHDCPKGQCKHIKGNKHRADHVVLASSIGGSISGFVSKALTYPLDLTKRRLQLASFKKSKRYKIPKSSMHLVRCSNLFECLALTLKKEGIKGLFRGLTITVYKAQLTSLVGFTSYELYCYILREIDTS